MAAASSGLATRIFTESFAGFLKRLDETPDGDGGSMLDNSIFLYGSNMTNGNHQNFPLPGAITLAMLLTVYFIVHGISSFSLAFAMKGHTGRWVLLLVSGAIDFLLAGLVIAGWPGSSIFILGIYVGINLLFTGFALISAALGARSA